MTDKEKHFQLYDEIIKLPDGLQFLRDVDELIKQNVKFRKAINGLLMLATFHRDYIKAYSICFPELRDQLLGIEATIYYAEQALKRAEFKV